MLVALGFDPDLHYTAGAVVSLNDNSEISIIDLRIFTPPIKLIGQQAAAAMCACLSIEARDWSAGMNYAVNIIVAEGQQITRATKNWDSITVLGAVSGACLAATIPAIGGAQLRASIPTPGDWTGGIPKAQRQARLWTGLKIPYELRGSKDSRYAVPKNTSDRRGFSVGNWKHLGDAVGLALWGLSQLDNN